MPAPIGPYTVEAHYPETGLCADRDHWIVLVNDRLEYCRGYLRSHSETQGPRPALRLVRIKDGRVLESFARCDEQGVGMVAGWPTGEQMLGAARRLLGRVRVHRDYVSEGEADVASRALAVLVAGVV